MAQEGKITDFRELEGMAASIRVFILKMLHRAKIGHAGTALSMVDILTALYFNNMNIDPSNPKMEDRDRFILSKGHGCSALYTTLAKRGFFSEHELMSTYVTNGSPFTGHINSHGIPGVEVSTGSLGHGLPIGAGMAYAAKLDGKKHRVFVIISDGECNEGSTWEALLFAPHHKLDNLTVIIDYNKIQSYGTVKEVLDLEPFAEKLRAHNWAVREIDGHSMTEIVRALNSVPLESGRPSCIIAHTIKGKGWAARQNTVDSHYWPPTEEDVKVMSKELLGEDYSSNLAH